MTTPIHTLNQLRDAIESWPGVTSATIRERHRPGHDDPALFDVTLVVTGDPAGGLDSIRTMIGERMPDGLVLHVVAG